MSELKKARDKYNQSSSPATKGEFALVANTLMFVVNRMSQMDKALTEMRGKRLEFGTPHSSSLFSGGTLTILQGGPFSHCAMIIHNVLAFFPNLGRNPCFFHGLSGFVRSNVIGIGWGDSTWRVQECPKCSKTPDRGESRISQQAPGTTSSRRHIE